MRTDRDTARIVRSWLEEGVTALPDRVLDAVLDRLPATPQRRPLWPAWRVREMNNPLKIAIAGVAIVVVAIVGISVLPRSGGVGGSGPGPTSIPTETAAPPSTAPPSTSSALPGFIDGPVRAGTYVLAPFTAAGEGMCHVPPQSGCTETTADDAIRFTMTVPEGWHGLGPWVFVEDNEAPDGAGLAIERGAWLLSDPCQSRGPRIPVGPTVADFVDAVAKHPILDTTTPVDVTLAGYPGKYFDLQVPGDISTVAPNNPACPSYRPWEPGIYANGPSQRWHLWVIDVDGVRVVVHSMDYAGTSAAHRAELQVMMDSLKIES
jgi:hypothetical protein